MNMEILDIKKELAGNSYPGRGIVIGKSADGAAAKTRGRWDSGWCGWR